MYNGGMNLNSATYPLVKNIIDNLSWMIRDDERRREENGVVKALHTIEHCFKSQCFDTDRQLQSFKKKELASFNDHSVRQFMESYQRYIDDKFEESHTMLLTWKDNWNGLVGLAKEYPILETYKDRCLPELPDDDSFSSPLERSKFMMDVSAKRLEDGMSVMGWLRYHVKLIPDTYQQEYEVICNTLRQKLSYVRQTQLELVLMEGNLEAIQAKRMDLLKKYTLGNYSLGHFSSYFQNSWSCGDEFKDALLHLTEKPLRSSEDPMYAGPNLNDLGL